MTQQNLFTPVKKTDEEFFETLLSTSSTRIEKIISEGHSSPENFWYDQDEWEWVAVLQGDAEIEFENEKINLSKGDYIFIPKHKKHRVTKTSTKIPCIWLAVFGKD